MREIYTEVNDAGEVVENIVVINHGRVDLMDGKVELLEYGSKEMAAAWERIYEKGKLLPTPMLDDAAPVKKGGGKNIHAMPEVVPDGNRNSGGKR